MTDTAPALVSHVKFAVDNRLLIHYVVEAITSKSPNGEVIRTTELWHERANLRGVRTSPEGELTLIFAKLDASELDRIEVTFDATGYPTISVHTAASSDPNTPTFWLYDESFRGQAVVEWTTAQPPMGDVLKLGYESDAMGLQRLLQELYTEHTLRT